MGAPRVPRHVIATHRDPASCRQAFASFSSVRSPRNTRGTMNFSKTGLVVGFFSFVEASGRISGPVYRKTPRGFVARFQGLHVPWRPACALPTPAAGLPRCKCLRRRPAAIRPLQIALAVTFCVIVAQELWPGAFPTECV